MKGLWPIARPLATRATLGLLGACITVAVAPSSHAAWPTNASANLPVCTTPGNQDQPQVTSDGAGGVLIAWRQVSWAETGDIFVQHVTAEGRLSWGKDGVAVCRIGEEQSMPAMAADSSGGAIITWQDHRSTTGWDIYAQRIDRRGQIRWRANGAKVSGATGDQVAPTIAPDGRGGAVIAWQDFRADVAPDLFAQGLDSNGEPRWSADGTPVMAAPGAQQSAQILGAASGECTIIWTDMDPEATHTSIRAQRLDVDGNTEWGSDGVRIAEDVPATTHPAACNGPLDFIFVAWEAGAVRAQKLDENGRAVWASGGVALSKSDGSAPGIVPDRSGGAIVVWQSAAFEGVASDIRAQSIREIGTLRWGPEGAPVCQAAGTEAGVVVVTAPAGGAIVVWRDARSDDRGDFYAQRIDSSAMVRWHTDGVVLSDSPGFQDALTATEDGRGGLIAVWSGSRAGRHLYAQRADSSGALGGVRERGASGGRSSPGSQPPPSQIKHRLMRSYRVSPRGVRPQRGGH